PIASTACFAVEPVPRPTIIPFSICATAASAAASLRLSLGVILHRLLCPLSRSVTRIPRFPMAGYPSPAVSLAEPGGVRKGLALRRAARHAGILTSDHGQTTRSNSFRLGVRHVGARMGAHAYRAQRSVPARVLGDFARGPNTASGAASGHLLRGHASI